MLDERSSEPACAGEGAPCGCLPCAEARAAALPAAGDARRRLAAMGLGPAPNLPIPAAGPPRGAALLPAGVPMPPLGPPPIAPVHLALIDNGSPNFEPDLPGKAVTSPFATSDVSLGLGANAWTGEDFTSPEDCCYTFRGYALPLHDPVAKHLLGEARNCNLNWRSELGYHVNTASTHTVKVAGKWRMYLPEPRVLADDPTVAGLEYEWPRYLPDDVTSGVRVQRFPAESWSALTPRFSPNFIAFVDSPDGGFTFPVFGPVVYPTHFDDAGCADVRDVDHANWTAAGWTPTAIPSRNAATDVPVDGLYAIYRDPSVIDLYATHGMYLMIVVECRSTSPTLGDEVCHPCIHSPGVTTCGPVYTRIVLFASSSPDFPAVGVPGGVWPDPKDWTRAAVLLDGGGDPLLGTMPDEAYGVPSATLSPDGKYLLLYTSVANPDPKPDTEWVAARVTARYPNVYAVAAGLSCFAVEVDDLARVIDEARYWEALGAIAIADTMRVGIRSMVESGYQGEVILSDGHMHREGFQILAQLQNLDPQFTVIDGELWVHFVATESSECTEVDPEAGFDCTAAVHQVRRARAVLVTPDMANPGGFEDDAWKHLGKHEWFPEAQVPFALFLKADPCFTLLDMAALTGATGAGLTRDPDVADLAVGVVRISFAGGSRTSQGANIPSGLMYATRRLLCGAAEDGPFGRVGA